MSDKNSAFNENEGRYQALGQNPETIMEGIKTRSCLLIGITSK